jgi:hypothetical protein
MRAIKNSDLTQVLVLTNIKDSNLFQTPCVWQYMTSVSISSELKSQETEGFPHIYSGEEVCIIDPWNLAL